MAGKIEILHELIMAPSTKNRERTTTSDHNHTCRLSQARQARKSNTTCPQSCPSKIKTPRTSALSNSKPSSNSDRCRLVRMQQRKGEHRRRAYQCKSRCAGACSRAVGNSARRSSRQSTCTVPGSRPVRAEGEARNTQGKKKR